jgi:hypothetical protein
METEKTKSANGKDGQSHPQRENVREETDRTRIWVAIIGLLALVLSALIASLIEKDAQLEAARTQLTAVWIPISATQTAEAKVIPTAASDLASQAIELAIEEIPQNVFVFAGNDNPDGGWGVFYLVYDENHIPVYQMDYSLPGDRYGYAGLVFQFPEGYSLSEYRGVEFTIIFPGLSNQIDLFVKDIADNNNKLTISSNGMNELELSYSFTNFPDINFSAVKEIGVIASTDLSRGDHQVKLKKIRFVK